MTVGKRLHLSFAACTGVLVLALAGCAELGARRFVFTKTSATTAVIEAGLSRSDTLIYLATVEARTYPLRVFCNGPSNRVRTLRGDYEPIPDDGIVQDFYTYSEGCLDEIPFELSLVAIDQDLACPEARETLSEENAQLRNLARQSSGTVATKVAHVPFESTTCVQRHVESQVPFLFPGPPSEDIIVEIGLTEEDLVSE